MEWLSRSKKERPSNSLGLKRVVSICKRAASNLNSQIQHSRCRLPLPVRDRRFTLFKRIVQRTGGELQEGLVTVFESLAHISADRIQGTAFPVLNDGLLLSGRD